MLRTEVAPRGRGYYLSSECRRQKEPRHGNVVLFHWGLGGITLALDICMIPFFINNYTIFHDFHEECETDTIHPKH